MIAILVKLFKALNSEQSPNQLAVAVSLAAILGLTPLLSLHNLLILLIALWFKVNLTLLIISYPLFALIGFILSPTFDGIGLMILKNPNLVPIWEGFFNTLFGRWSNFYFTGVMGSFVVGLILAVVLFPIVKSLVSRYRENWMLEIEKFRVIKTLKATRFWQLYTG